MAVRVYVHSMYVAIGLWGLVGDGDEGDDGVDDDGGDGDDEDDEDVRVYVLSWPGGAGVGEHRGE